MVSVRLLEKPTDEQIERMAAIFGKAFEGYTQTAAMTGGDRGLEPALILSMLRGGTFNATFYVVEQDNEIVACALCYRPGEWLYKSEESKAQGWNAYWETISPECREWWNYAIGKQQAGGKEYLGDKKTNSWHLDIIGTEPKHQRKGYGKALMDAIYSRARDEGTILTFATQTESNAKWYRSIGCKEHGRIEIESAYGNYPSMFFSWE